MTLATSVSIPPDPYAVVLTRGLRKTYGRHVALESLDLHVGIKDAATGALDFAYLKKHSNRRTGWHLSAFRDYDAFRSSTNGVSVTLRQMSRKQWRIELLAVVRYNSVDVWEYEAKPAKGTLRSR